MRNIKETVNYIFFGVLTTLVNIFVYFLLTHLFIIDFRIATSIAWIVSVLFAFITNKKYVFKSNNHVFRELLLFFTARIASYAIDLGGMILLVYLFHIDDGVAKIWVNILVIVLNYFLSKFLIFK
ncbi:GtrA-like protein [compost metagenome]|uniref:GtrA family protein n=2 Tax=Paenibacillus TaxID=44249 RepID=UPI000FA9FF6F